MCEWPSMNSLSCLAAFQRQSIGVHPLGLLCMKIWLTLVSPVFDCSTSRLDRTWSIELAPLSRLTRILQKFHTLLKLRSSRTYHAIARTMAPSLDPPDSIFALLTRIGPSRPRQAFRG